MTQRSFPLPNMSMVKEHVEPSKELELLTKAFLLENPELFVGEKKQKENNGTKSGSNKVLLESKKASQNKNQFTTFQDVMKLLLIYGQCIALNPVTGILEKDVTKIRYRWFSCKVIYSLIVGGAQLISLLLSIYRLLNHDVFIQTIAFCSFYMSTSYTTFMFLRVAIKWPSLMKELHNCGLDEYTDLKLKFKCYLAFFILLLLALLDHVSFEITRYTETLDCTTNKNQDMYEKFIRICFPWVFSSGAEYSMPLGILLQALTIISTFNWSYPDLFIICISIYLTAILNCINNKIERACKNSFLPPSFMRGLREDYNRAAQLVRSFDDRVSGIVFLSFANKLFFVCFQLYNTLSFGIKPRQMDCPNYPSSPLGGYEASIYQIFSLFYLLGKYLAVSLIASDVHIASVKPIPALYNVASSAYCSEVQRFLDQVHCDTVALSGFRFFYVTRELILTVAGTIVTYELVLLQFSNE